MKFVITAAEQTRRELAVLNQKPPAIVQPAAVKKDWKFYEDAISNSEAFTGLLYEEYRDGKTWKEQYKTWEDACVPLGKSRRQVDRIIAKDNQKRTECPNTETQQEQNALSQVEQAREEEPEKPRVKTARESMADAAYAEREEANQVPLECPKCLGSGWIGVKPKEVSEPCKCGCDLTVNVCQTLAEHGVPSIGLTTGQAGLLMGKIKANEWKLPKAFEFAKNDGEWLERKFKGKPAPKT